MFQTSQGPQSPTVFFEQPTLEQIVSVVNANTARVNQLQTSAASLSVTGVPTLQCDIALERPLRFRMTAGTRITGNELDLGSNDNLFWFWARRNQEPAVYFARHNEFRNAAAAQIMPVPPSWIIDAIGLVQLANDGSTTGPFPVGSGRLEIRSRTNGTGGVLNRSIVVDDQRGHVLEQRVFDEGGQLLATSITSDHYYDPTSGVTLPRQIDIQLPPAQMAFTISASGYQVNQLSADGLQLWSMPQKDGHQVVDLARLSSELQANSVPTGAPTVNGTMSPNVGYQAPANWPPPYQPGQTPTYQAPANQVVPATNTSPFGMPRTGSVIRQQSWRRQFGWW